ncbi:hypothetical protein OIV83_004410 [Microbotryomycetes sp. JL201]|nr:hypothetical protein OIV83_004410 [Microbotryomycetes sp. JL201]
MLDHFTIVTQGGVVLWSRSFTPAPSPVDALIREALIEERATAATSDDSSLSSVSTWHKDGYALVWTLANNLQLVFVVAYQRILQLAYAQDLVQHVKRAFVAAYADTVQHVIESTSGKSSTSTEHLVRALQSGSGWSALFKGWDDTFNKILRDLEAASAQKAGRAHIATLVSFVLTCGCRHLEQAKRTPKPKTIAVEDTLPTPGQQEQQETLDAQTIARNIAALKARQKAKGRKSGAAADAAAADTGSDTDGSRPTTPAKKAATKWADSKVTAADMAAYDYSSDAPSSGAATPSKNLVSSAALGKRSKSGLYEVADYATANPDGDDDGDDIDGKPAQSTSALSSLFSKLSLTSKALTKSDLQPALEQMRQHLMSKNVARDIAEKVCDSVGKSLEGRKVSGFSAVKKEVRRAMEDALVRILTPKSSTDILLEVQRKKAMSTTMALKRAPSSSDKGKTTGVDPYTITFVGVNGVGKSTNLSKVAFWLLQNRLRVLIAACDTFRSGAVEQLRVHVRNLGQLGQDLGGVGVVSEDGTQMIELYEKGYGKDAAGIAKEAIAYGKDKGFDVVLIDTAGRMQDNEPLMRALAKLVTVNNPDKIVFVGEALVGNEAVDQLTKFNRSLRDFSGQGNARGIDGMILTKFDTIDDKVGAALSMTYVTGQPILFVGTGQTYSDLRALRVQHIVQALLQE